jgi:hypothetical protein
MKTILLLLLLPTLAVAQTRTIHFDLSTGQTVAENFLPPDTGYIYIERGNHAVLQLVPRDYYFYPQPYPLIDYSHHRCYRHR